MGEEPKFKSIRSIIGRYDRGLGLAGKRVKIAAYVVGGWKLHKLVCLELNDLTYDGRNLRVTMVEGESSVFQFQEKMDMGTYVLVDGVLGMMDGKVVLRVNKVLHVGSVAKANSTKRLMSKLKRLVNATKVALEAKEANAAKFDPFHPYYDDHTWPPFDRNGFEATEAFVIHIPWQQLWVNKVDPANNKKRRMLELKWLLEAREEDILEARIRIASSMMSSLKSEPLKYGSSIISTCTYPSSSLSPSGDVEWHSRLKSSNEEMPDYIHHQQQQLNSPSISPSSNNMFGERLYNPWMQGNFLNPVRDQKEGLCCYAFVACAAIEAVVCRHHRIKTEFSPQDIYDRLIHSEEEDIRGRSVVETFEWIKNHGVVLEADYPYAGRFPQPFRPRPRTFDVGILSYRELNHSAIETWLNKSPVAAHVHWTEELERIQPDQIYSGPTNPEAFNIGIKHAMLIVGYGTKYINGRERHYWIVRNSHGSQWGDGGYCRIDRVMSWKVFGGGGCGA